jgi:hypothetical protein
MLYFLVLSDGRHTFDEFTHRNTENALKHKKRPVPAVQAKERNKEK